MIGKTIYEGVLSHPHEQICIPQPLYSICGIGDSPKRNLSIEGIDHPPFKSYENVSSFTIMTREKPTGIQLEAGAASLDSVFKEPQSRTWEVTASR